MALTSTGAAMSILGTAWVQIPVPRGASGLIVDRANAGALAAGGASVQTTTDGGKHWAATPTQPAATGPFVPLVISPWDPHVLFVSAGGQVAVTTDGGSTWQNVGVPPGGQPVMAIGNAPGTFFVGAGGNVYQLVDNGAQVNPRPPLPAGASVTSLAIGQFLVVAGCSSGQTLVLKGTKWTTPPVTGAGPFAVHGLDIWAASPTSGGTAAPAVLESSDGGVTWQARPGLPAGEAVLSVALSGDGHTVYVLTNLGNVYESQNGVWYLLSTGAQVALAGTTAGSSG